MSWKIIIISGGQTGADRAALDFAITHGFPHGGWCPKGRIALDGPLDAKYQLKETPSEEALERTGWNVRDSDGTVVFTLAPKATGVAQKTLSVARKLKRPCLHFHRGSLAASEKLVAFLEKYSVRRLNVSGSEDPAIYQWVTEVLEKTKTNSEL